jgi:hypothetical protein
MCVKTSRYRPLFIFGTPITAERHDFNQRVCGLDALDDLISADSRKADIKQD